MDVYVVGAYDDERVYMSVAAVTTDKNKAEELKAYLDSWTCNSGVIEKFNTDDIQDLLKKYREDATEYAMQNEERNRIIKELEKETRIITDCYGECFTVIPKKKAIEIVKRGWLEEANNE